MKKILSIICSTVVLLSLAGCGKKDSLSDDSNVQIGTDVSESTSGNDGSSVNDSENSVPVLPDIPRQKISELRGELEEQVNTVKAAEHINLNITEDFVVKVPDTDILYDLTLTPPKVDFQAYYEKFDKTFDKEFGDIYSQEDKETLYHVSALDDDFGGYRSESALLANHIEKFLNGEKDIYEIYVDTEKAYLAMFRAGNGIYGLNHDGTVKRAKVEDYKPASVALTFGTNYFDVVKNYLDIDSDDKFEILDAELSVKDAAETAKKITAENEYSWGGSLEPDVYQVKVLDIGDGKYGFSFTMTASYKGVLFDAFETIDDSGMNTRDQKLDHNYVFLSPNAFMMENDKFDSFSTGRSEYSATETAAYDSVIPFKDAAQMLSDKFGLGMNLSVSRAELLYSSMYYVNGLGTSVMKAFPVWKFRCYNSTDNFKYVVYVNAVTGSIEYYITDWWEI